MLEELYDHLRSKYGKDHQVDKCIEEMSELTKALLKYRHDPSAKNMENLYEELADTRIMLEQMEHCFCSKNLLEKMREKKIAHLIERSNFINETKTHR